MEPIIYQETEDKPWVNLDKENNTFEIGGKSLPENSSEFYSPILKWISEYVKDPNKTTHFVCKIEYFNSSSARRFYEIFSELDKIKQTGNEIKITWYYEKGDRLMENKGHELKSILEIPFEVLPLE